MGGRTRSPIGSPVTKYTSAEKLTRGHTDVSAHSDLRDRLDAADSVEDRVKAVEDSLLTLLAVGRASKPVVSQAVHLITQHNGAIRIDELCRRLGYSRRYLGICLHPGVQALLGPCSTAYLSARNEFGDLFYGA